MIPTLDWPMGLRLGNSSAALMIKLGVQPNKFRGKVSTSAVIAELAKERKQMTADVAKAKAAATKTRDKLKAFRVARKTDDSSLYSKIDDILSKNKIQRAAYHGGQLTGVCVKQLMYNADNQQCNYFCSGAPAFFS